MSLEKTKAWIKTRLGEEKYLHSLGAEETAKELAFIFGIDQEKASLAGLIHDNAKEIPYEEMLIYIKNNNLNIEESIKTNRKILHAYLGAYMAQKELGITDQEILDAIKYHTTGKPDMTLFEKIIFLADKIEANTRNLDFRDKILNILKETNNIDKATLCCIDSTIRSLLDRKLPINAITIDVWNYYIGL
ncbi:MAG TPA: bis(5'-nucleosyl)-tetraphosphatase (symmetrical) YqeK [Candidatus Gastranaerophilales bacterium]|nr:bis(5'-nucleosyl)-tetraphosphatase (symmetrical) YqeK [Candidatus Gastranaerophilales bacterium]